MWFYLDFLPFIRQNKEFEDIVVELLEVVIIRLDVIIIRAS